MASMKWALFLLAVGAFGQATITLSPAPGLAPAGATVVLTVSLVTGGGPAAVQWDMSGVPSIATVASLVTGKQIQCSATMTRCLVYSLSTAAIADGPIATISYMQPATPPTEALASPVSASPTATAITTTVGPSTNRCDVNGDGKIDGADITAMIAQIFAGTVAGARPNALDIAMIILAGLGGSCLR